MVKSSMEAAGIEPAQDSPGWVYVVRSPDGPFRTRFKIGWTTKEPRKRLASLQTGSPIQLELMGVFPGGRELERELHERWKWYRENGEWFAHPPDLLDLLVEKGRMVHPMIEEIRKSRAYFAELAAKRDAEAA